MKVLYSPAEIRVSIERLGAEISERYRGREVTLLSVLRGGLIFTADLLRALDLSVRLDAVRARTYHGASHAPGEAEVSFPPGLALAGAHVLIVDDILDTGVTLSRIIQEVQTRGAESVASVVLLDKPDRRIVSIEADWVGFRIPNVWVVGYGLDHAERFRNLPHLAALEPQDGDASVT